MKWRRSQTLLIVSCFTFILLALFAPQASAELKWRWARADGFYMGIGAVGADQQGSVYAAGTFTDGSPLTIGNIALQRLPRGGLFLAKYDAAGAVLWAKWVATETDYPMAYALAVDPQGNVHLAGTFRDRITVGKFTLEGFGLSTFVAKFDPNGWVIWADQIRDTPSDNQDGHAQARGLALDAEGNVYLLDQFLGTLALGETVIRTPSDYPDGFVAKFDPTGKPLWAMNAGDAVSLAVEPTGDFCLAGLVTGSSLVGDVRLSSTNNETPMFIARCARTGHVLWARQSTSGLSSYPFVAVDARGNSVLATTIYGEAGFGRETVTTGQPYLAGPFLARFDPSGLLLWVKASVAGSTLGLISDPLGRLTLPGTFYGTAQLDALTLTNTPYREAFYLAELDEAGTFRSAETITSSHDITWRSPALGADQGRYLLASISSSIALGGLSVSNVNSGISGKYTLAATSTGEPVTTSVASVQLASETSFVTRTLPAFYAADRVLNVSLAVDPPPASGSYSVEEIVPAGSLVSQLNPVGAYDSLRSTIKFGPFSEGQARQLSYEVKLAPASTGLVQFAGRALRDGVAAPIEGSQTADLATFHPADLGDAVYSLSWRELEGYANAWRSGSDWPAMPVRIPIQYLTTAGKIWTAGGTYSVSRSVTNAPALWLSPDVLANAASAKASLALPDAFAPGVPFNIDLVLEPGPGIGCTAAEIRLPSNWTISGIKGEGEFETQSSTVRWGPFFGDSRKTVSCSVAADVPSAVPEFVPVVSMDGALVPVQGRTTIPLPRQLTARVSQGELNLFFWREPRQRYQLSTSTDLVNWQPLSDLTSTNGLYLWNGPIGTAASAQFFRVTPSASTP